VNIQEQIIKLVSRLADMPTSKIYAHSYFKDDLNLDSIDQMLIIVKLEKLFNVILPNEDVDRIETVKDVSESIMRNLHQERIPQVVIA
jgi:acyl carrier protein